MSERKEQEKIKKIREYILKSGFPLEIEIGKILRKNGWIVGNQWPYIDKESGKIRSADVFAMKMRLQPPKFGVTLLVECKKGLKHDWVFHTQEKEKEFFPFLGVFVDFLKKFEGIPLNYELAYQSENETVDSKLSGIHLLDNSIKIGVFNIIPSAKDKDDFYIATNQVISALRARGKRKGVKSEITFPVIVFDGEIFEFYKENDETKILPTNHLQFMSFEKSELGTLPCLIDVVRKTYFSEFLQLIERDFYILTQLVKSKGVKP